MSEESMKEAQAGQQVNERLDASEKPKRPYYLSVFPGCGQEPLIIGDRLIVTEIVEDVQDPHWGKCTSYTLRKDEAI